MGFFDRMFRGKGRAVIPSDSAMIITESGKDALQEFGGDVRGRILLALETRGSSDVMKISEATGLTRGQIERAVPSLLRSGYVRFPTTGSGCTTAGAEVERCGRERGRQLSTSVLWTRKGRISVRITECHQTVT